MSESFEIVRITRQCSDAGLCSFIVTMLDVMALCYQKKLIPVVDWTDEQNPTFHSKDTLGLKNPWLDYFHQPCFIDQPQISYKNLKTIRWTAALNGLSWRQPLDTQRMLGRLFIHPQNDILDIVNDFWYRNCSGKNVLGVRIRGTDYNSVKPAFHNKQPNIDSVMSDVEKIIREKHIDKIFLTTESSDYMRKMLNRFGDMVCVNQSMFFQNDSQQMNCNFIKKAYSFLDIVQMNKEYLASIYILSKCQNVIMSKNNSQLLYNFIRSSDVQYEYIYDLGIY